MDRYSSMRFTFKSTVVIKLIFYSVKWTKSGCLWRSAFEKFYSFRASEILFTRWQWSGDKSWRYSIVFKPVIQQFCNPDYHANFIVCGRCRKKISLYYVKKFNHSNNAIITHAVIKTLKLSWWKKKQYIWIYCQYFYKNMYFCFQCL